MATSGQSSGDQCGNRWRGLVWGGAAALLLVPAIAMQFDAGVDWTALDFVVMGTMLFVACGTWDLATRRSGNGAYRGAVAVAMAGAFLMTWVNLAVGIIGNEDNPLNLLFFAVPAIGVAGALLARFRPAGMARALLAMAVAQGLVGVITLAVGDLSFVLSGFFAALWLIAAGLFRRAARGSRDAA